MTNRGVDAAALARLEARLKLPERAPDEAFVARVALEAEAWALQAGAKREQRRQLAIDASAAVALLMAAKELGATAESAVWLLPPVSMELGAAGLICAILLLLFGTLAAGWEERTTDSRGGTA